MAVPTLVKITMRSSSAARLETLRALTRRGDFLVGLAVGVLGLALVYYWLLTQVSNFGRLAEAIRTEPAYLAGIAVLLPVSFGLFGLNFAVLLILRRARLRLGTQAGTALGATAGALAVGCPLCGAYLLTLLGVTSGLAALPFGGLELWTLAAGVMGFTLFRSLGSLKQCAGSHRSASCSGLTNVKRRDVGLLVLLAALMALGLVVMVLVNEPFLG